MAVSTNVCNVHHFVAPPEAAVCSADSYWVQNATSADASGCETVKAAPAAGKSLYVDLLMIAAATNVTITIGAGKDGTNPAVGTTLIGPIPFPNAGGLITLDFRDTPIYVAAATALTVDASGAGNINIFAKGFIKNTCA